MNTISILVSIRIIIALLLICFVSTGLSAQARRDDCKDIHSGIFYFYPKNSTDQYVETRDENYLHEINTVTGDSVSWQIKWINSCKYFLHYISGSEQLTAEQEKFMQKHRLVYEINEVTDQYYLFKSYLDAAVDFPFQDDTVWLNKQSAPSNTQLFVQVPDSLVFAPVTISDTSHYALLYIYRPGKIALSLSDYPLFFDDAIMWVARNNSGALFKIVKEGHHEVGSRLYQGQSSVPLDVKFGQVYYIKSTMNWGVHSKLSNFKLDNNLVSKEEGKADFNKVKPR